MFVSSSIRPGYVGGCRYTGRLNDNALSSHSTRKSAYREQWEDEQRGHSANIVEGETSVISSVETNV